MSVFVSDLLKTVLEGLALLGAVAVLLTLVLCGLVVRTSKRTNGTTSKPTNEVSRHFLLFILLVALTIGLVTAGFQIPVALGANFLLLVVFYRELRLVVFSLAGGVLLLYALLPFLH